MTEAEDEAKKENAEDMLHGAAVLKRLVSLWSESHRFMCAVSYSVSDYAAEMPLNLELKFIGVVKTATRLYPMDYLSKQNLPERRQHNSLVSKGLNGNNMTMALM